MKRTLPLLLFVSTVSWISCSRKIYESNGETIYRTGRNIKGERLADPALSRIRMKVSCQTCHGRRGDMMQGTSIRWASLSDAGLRAVPYSDSLFNRFLDHDLKSNGRKADIGIIWKMSDDDKRDLLEFLKKLDER